MSVYVCMTPGAGENTGASLRTPLHACLLILWESAHCTLHPCPIGPKPACLPSGSSPLSVVICDTNLLVLRQSSVWSSGRSCLHSRAAHSRSSQRWPPLQQRGLPFLLRSSFSASAQTFLTSTCKVVIRVHHFV